jgi:hypothetical protein
MPHELIRILGQNTYVYMYVSKQISRDELYFPNLFFNFSFAAHSYNVCNNGELYLYNSIP